MNDLRDSISRLLNDYKIYQNEARFVLITECIQEMYDTMDDENKDKLRLLLFEEGIKHLAGI